MRLRWNISASYASQFYSTFIGIVMVPIYLRYMGTEAYGLIGLFSIFQLCIQSLDLGITPTLTRESARTRAGATSPLLLRQLLGSFEIIFCAMGALIVLLVAVTSGYIATRWIKSAQLDPAGIMSSLVLMSLIGWLRWFAGLYRGIVNGFEKQVWQSGVNIGIATAHSIAVIPYLVYVGSTPTDFFAYQLAVSVIEFILVSRKAYSLLPLREPGVRVYFQFGAVKSVFRFSAVIAMTTLLWVAVTQIDKVLLSRILSLSDFGLFSLATLLAGGVTTLSFPLSNALLPRLTELSARDEGTQFVALYRNATQFTAVLAFSAALFLAMFARNILWVWTGNPHIAAGASMSLTLYALGNGVAAFGAFPYYLQYAKGDVRLHLVGTLLFLAVLVPSVVLLTLRYGAMGAGAAWLGTNLCFLLIWVPYVHSRFFKGLHMDWILRDIVSIAVMTALVGFAARFLVVWPDSRVGSGALLFGFAVLSVMVAGTSSSFVRQYVLSMGLRFRNQRRMAGG